MRINYFLLKTKLKSAKQHDDVTVCKKLILIYIV